MFKVHVESSDLLLEDCRVNANGWLRLSLLHGGASINSSSLSSNGSPSTSTSAVDIECLATVAEERQDPHAIPIHAVYGIYSLLSGPYLAGIKDARVIGSGPNSEKLYCILEVELIPISAAAHKSFFKHASKREQNDEREYIRMIKSVFASRTFYFSYDYDLTLSAQRCATRSIASNPRPSTVPAMWQQAEEDFFWNKPVLGPFLQLQLDTWIIPVISGFIKVLKKFEIYGMRCDMIFFTRRSCKRVGTRFNVRGVDKDGYVANFAESEMIIVKPNRGICSYVQIRGSIPLYWDQVVTLKYMPKTRYAFSGNESIVDWNELAFRAHLDGIIQRYGHITIINLIDKTGTSRTVRDQAQLGTAYGKYVKKYNLSSHQEGNQTMFPPPISPTTTSKPRSTSNAHSPVTGTRSSVVGTSISQLFHEPIVYIWFDFHHECRKMQWHHLSKLMTEVQEQFTCYGWFESDAEGRVLSRQKGVFRVNCMDNLDRTNVVMSLFARRAVLLSLSLSNDTSNVLDSPYEVFEVAFKNTWADNADYISKMYAGTGALKTDFTRTGKRTMTGAIQDGINSVTRYYLNNFNDGKRQDSYDLVVGNYVPDRRDESPFTFQQQHSLLYFCIEMSFVVLVVMGISISWRQEVSLSIRMRDGMIAALVLLLGIGHLILKKGILRSVGRRYVCKPAFCSSGYIRKKDA